MTSVAAKEIEHLSDGLAPEDILQSIHASNRSLGGLRNGYIPKYDNWDALQYSLRHQTSQINLAYTICRLISEDSYHNIPKHRNPLRTAKGGVQVVDYGCGELALQFGLALAAADTLEELGAAPRISVRSEDESQDMIQYGQKIWIAFVNEIVNSRKYPELEPLKVICQDITLNSREVQEDWQASNTTLWLAALHVAYRDNAESVRANLDERIMKLQPDLVIITSHSNPNSSRYAYVPASSVYRAVEYGIQYDEENRYGYLHAHEQRRPLRLTGQFMNASKFTADNKLNSGYNTSWAIPGYEAVVSLYIKDTITVDDLPF